MNKEQYDQLTYRQTESHHNELRAMLYDEVQQKYAHLGLDIREITLNDVHEAESWKGKWQKAGRAATWDWVNMYYEYHARGGARRFDMAVCKAQRLLGLTYGMLERNRLILKVHAMEANPVDNPIAGSMLKITLYAANMYAIVNDTPEIWLCTPVSDAHVRLYKAQGYTPYYDRFDNCTHLMKRLK